MKNFTPEQLQEVFDTDPAFGHDLDDAVMDAICVHVANGGSATELCDIWLVKYGAMSNWIHKSKERSKRFREALNDRGEWSLEKILDELRKLALVRIGDIFNPDHTLKPPDQWPAGIASAIAGIDVQELFAGKGDNREMIGYVKKVKFYDKGRALELLGKNLRAFTDKVEHSADESLEELIKQSMVDNDEQEEKSSDD